MISIDHKWRDGFCLVRLGEILCQKFGHKVIYIRNGLEKYYLPLHSPDVVVWNHVLEESRRKLATELVSQGKCVIILPTEGMPTMIKTLERSSIAMPGIDLSSVSRFLFWGEYVRNTVLSHNSSLETRAAIVVGSPRFDVYHRLNSHLLTDKSILRSQLNLDSESKTVLFATNFVQAKFLKNIDFFINDIKKHVSPVRTAKENSELISIATQSVQQDHKTRDIFLRAMRHVIDEIPGIVFLLKPHPQEEYLFYKNWLDEQPLEIRNRFRLIENLQIWDCLNLCDIEVSRSCSTAVESWLLNKPTIDLQLNPDDPYISEEHARGSLIAKTSDELTSQIRACLNGPETVCRSLSEKRSTFIDKWVYKPDGCATIRAAEEIHLARIECNNKRNKTMLRGVTAERVKNLLIGMSLYISRDWIHDFAVQGVRNFFRSGKIDRLGRQDKYINQSDIKELQDRFRVFR